MGNKHGKSAAEMTVEDNSVLDLPLLPLELWELLLSYCSCQTLTINVPKVSKMCRKLRNNAWMIKFKRDYPDLQENPFDEGSWKDLYLGPHHFFPFLGFVIGKTTYKELEKTKGGILRPVPDEHLMKRVDVDNFNFDCEPLKHTFSRIKIEHWLNSYIPPEWQSQGLNWDRSYNSYKALFRRTTGNYIVNKTIKTPGIWADRQVTLTTTIKQQLDGEAIYYKLVLTFGYNPAVDEEMIANFNIIVVDASGTLDSIAFVTMPIIDPEYLYMVENYTDKIINDPDGKKK